MEDTQWIYTAGGLIALGLLLGREIPFTADAWSHESTAVIRASVQESWIEHNCWSNSTTNWTVDVSWVVTAPVIKN